MKFHFVRQSKGRPAEVLAKGVIRSLERKISRVSTKKPLEKSQEAESVPPIPREPSFPVDDSIYRVASKMRAEMTEEVEIEAAAEIAVSKKRQSDGRSVLNFEALSSGQVSMLMRHDQSQTGKPPETEPGQPNAPNTW